MDCNFELVLPAIRGIQAGREYFVTMCPLRLIPKLFVFDENELPPQIRAQRKLNKARLPEMTSYVVDNPDSYVFSALTASVDGVVRFDPASTDGESPVSNGTIYIPLDAMFIINDGQHRRAAIEAALEQRPELREETIAIVLFVDRGLARCQQMFADLNRYAIRPSRSLGILFDHRDEKAELARLLVSDGAIFDGIVECESSSLSERSKMLFTLSALYTATADLLQDCPIADPDERWALVRAFWEAVDSQIPEWKKVREQKLSAAEVRRTFIHPHGVALHAIGRAGHALLASGAEITAARLSGLQQIDWSRASTELWEGRAFVGGKLSKRNDNVALTAALIKSYLGLPLSEDEVELERLIFGECRNAAA